MVVIRHAVWTVTLTPIQTLRRRRVTLTLQTLVAPGTIAQIARSPEDRQVADDRPFIISMTLTNLSSTLTADCPFFGALDGDDQFANFVDFCLQYPHFRDV